MDGVRTRGADDAQTPLIGRWQRDEDRGSIICTEERLSSTVGEGELYTEGEFGQRLKRAKPRIDSLDVEAMQVHGAQFSPFKDHTLAVTLRLAFQTIGVIYGDMGTSPLYVYSSAFNELDINGSHDILGALSIIIYTLTLIPLIKYTLVVLRADSSGESEYKGHWLEELLLELSLFVFGS